MLPGGADNPTETFVKMTISRPMLKPKTSSFHYTTLLDQPV
jgi:hypothetical protein